jgi:undecaprenyl-diphosphatase
MNGLDYRVLSALDHFSGRHDTFEDTLGAYVGASEILFLALLALTFVALPRVRRTVGRRAVVAAGASAGLAVLIAHFVSAAVNRPRPFVTHASTIHPFLAHAPDPSLPSDHATAAFAIAIAILLRHRRMGLVWLALAVVVTVGRVFLGLHYPTDVLAGAALGSACAVLLTAPPARRVLDRIADAAGGVTDGLLARARLLPR